ncbi:DUF3742 family protein [Acerihabitans arboris]|uniref:DUF3742 family protein n=1 Tax=Acerihabitans arboris TaxID=2691583 RepID=A0A845ST28_9GAMM|nr:DUF3742 family protein [Acerihabitans arboris]NDL66074.1 DUF3742 family protein [Acerihabitans arboris]
MATQVHTERWTYRLGRGVRCAWRGYGWRERCVADWLIFHGIPAVGAKALLWFVKLVLFGMLLYFTFWLALLLSAVVAALVMRNADDEEEEWPIGEQAEHKDNPGYHPTLYNDAPDPRFDDPRYDDD